MKLLDFKDALKHWSTWFWCAALYMLTMFLAAPDMVVTWFPGLVPLLPPEWQAKSAALLGLAGFLSKFVKQENVQAWIEKVKNYLTGFSKDVSGQTKKIAASVLAAVALIASPMLQESEGLRQKAYLDIANYVTVCYGHMDPKIDRNKTYTIEECKNILATDLAKHTINVLSCAPKLAEDINSLAAWTQFDFNVGSFCSTKFSTMNKARLLIANGSIKASCAQMSSWVYAGGKVANGLVKRRARERALCERQAA